MLKIIVITPNIKITFILLRLEPLAALITIGINAKKSAIILQVKTYFEEILIGWLQRHPHSGQKSSELCTTAPHVLHFCSFIAGLHSAAKISTQIGYEIYLISDYISMFLY